MLTVEYFVQRHMVSEVDAVLDALAPPEERPRPAQVLRVVRPTRQEEKEWAEAPGPISPTEMKRKKARVPVREEP